MLTHYMSSILFYKEYRSWFWKMYSTAISKQNMFYREVNDYLNNNAGRTVRICKIYILSNRDYWNRIGKLLDFAFFP